ncbi:MAG: hypothetical protein ACK4P2_05835 [Hyphomonas sp.]
MSDFEEWKAIERDALEGGLEAALAEALQSSLTADNADQQRDHLLRYARFLGLRKDKSDFLAVAVLMISFELQRDYRTLFLIIRELYDAGKFELCALLCARYVDEFSDHADQAKLFWAAALVRIGDLERASEVAATISDPEADTWIDGGMRKAGDFRS